MPDDMTDPSSSLPPFDIQIATILLDEVSFNSSSLTAQPLPRDGGVRTAWKCRDGSFVTHRHSWSTGMGYLAKNKAYRDHFKREMPSWALPMPPMVIWRLSDVACGANQPLPTDFPQLRKGATTAARIAVVAEGAGRFTPG